MAFRAGSSLEARVPDQCHGWVLTLRARALDGNLVREALVALTASDSLKAFFSNAFRASWADVVLYDSLNAVTLPRAQTGRVAVAQEASLDRSVLTVILSIYQKIALVYAVGRRRLSWQCPRAAWCGSRIDTYVGAQYNASNK